MNRDTRAVQWKKVTLVGVGLLGGSLGLALKQRRLAGSVVGFVRRATSIEECVRLGAVDQATQDLAQAVADADLMVLCTPLAQMKPLVEQMLPSIKKGALVTDVGSVKATVVRDLEKLVAKAGAHFVGSHPMAGAEKMGVAAARADLFANAVCVVTPSSKTNRQAVRRIEQLWQAVDGRILQLTPQAHDELVGRSSHLPHLVAASLANFVLCPNHPKQQAMLCANGFRDTTRIASGSPEMWRDIALANRKHLTRALARFIQDLQAVHRMIAQGDVQSIESFLTRAKSRRDLWHKPPKVSTPE